MLTLTVRRRDLAWATALIVLLSTVWVARSDIADAGSEPPGKGIAIVYLAVGTNYPDALGSGPGAGLNGAPILLGPTNPPLNLATEAELVRLDPRTVVMIGGTSAISDAMEITLETLLPNASINRIGGANRYETNALFSAATFPVEGWASIGSSAFGSTDPDDFDVHVDEFSASNQTTGTLRSPIQLPHGATVVELEALVFDSTAGGLVSVLLVRVDSSGSGQIVADVGTTAGFNAGLTNLTTTTITVAGREIVDNELYTYHVQVTGANGNPYLRAVRVRYSLGVSG